MKATTPNITSETPPVKKTQLPLQRINYIIMAIAAAMIVLGFALISGGQSTDADTFNPEVFSTRRIVIGPLIAFLGFIVMGAGIMWPNDTKKSNTSTKR